ncbi:Conserved oligomeric Golgi complex subunit 2 [Dermatophagoides pteronyssinus]|uniref:Conserved oligomeric Golgi complex subunit 2 n=1 Tax=Dermatophagoides pteronyssinus TaxID=6956 RepID=A0ABQ8IQT4_DERPT|nr:Conserved oligomeric Golgi complex subunit 2 [Dermatophagoides pteronyssinus]
MNEIHQLNQQSINCDQQQQQRETFIPNVPDYYCFVDENFLSETFSVDGFVRRNSKRVQSLEILKEHLSAYLKLLKQSMVNLINADYTEFVNLSANLVSFDKLIKNIKTPVLKFKNETDLARSKTNETITLITAKHDRLKQIRENKRKLSMILEIIDYLDRIETNHERIESKISVYQNDFEAKRSEIYPSLGENSTLIARLNINFDCLWSSNETTKTNQTFVQNLRNRFERASQQFHEYLENELLFLINTDRSKDEQITLNLSLALEQIFALYLIDGQNQNEFERVIRTHIVQPCFQEIISNSNQVSTIFNRTIDLIENEWSLWINVLINTKQFESFKFNLIQSIIWNPFVDLFLIRSPILLDLSDLDQFEQNYFQTFKFVEQFVRLTAMSDRMFQFEQQSSFKRLKSKFKLNVYFHMKLRRLSSDMENRFDQLGYSINDKIDHQQNQNHQYRMNYCHDLPLGWLQLIWLKLMANLNKSSMINNDGDTKRLIRQTLIYLISDSNLFLNETTKLFTDLIEPFWLNYYRNSLIHRLSNNHESISEGSLRCSFDEFVTNFRTKSIDKLILLMRNEIVNECKIWLNQVNDIPRLYRRTNKEKPKEASNYVDKCLRQLIDCMGMLGNHNNDSTNTMMMINTNQCLLDILNDLTVHYKHLTLEVLTSVQKTEESLKKLKKHKGFGNSTTMVAANQSSNMSDDDKIRLQIYFDVTTLGKQLQEKLAIDIDSLKSYKELMATIESLKLLK